VEESSSFVEAVGLRTCDASYERVSHQRRSGIGYVPGELYGIVWIVGEGGKSSKEVNPRTMLPPKGAKTCESSPTFAPPTLGTVKQFTKWLLRLSL